MKERHKRREIYSFILVSNMDNRSRQLSISAVKLKVLLTILLFLVLTIGVFLYLFFSRSSKEYILENKLQAQEQQLIKLEEEIKRLTEYADTLSKEKEELQESKEKTLPQENIEEVSSGKNIPKLYPLDGEGNTISTFTVEQPYLIIDILKGNNVIATGDGVVTLIDYDDNYTHSIEIDHGEGYISRYLCKQKVEIKVEEGSQVKARDSVFAVVANNTQLYYQVMLNNEPLNPFQVMKGEE
ncbi:MAG: M23 family metallopeptidase [Lachnospiraceae bacterium]|nr:M23 family metallopeptidase [Lachnospiraceae bacterium]